MGKASGRFSSLKSGFCFHRFRLRGRKGALTIGMTPDLGSANDWKQGPGLVFRGHNAKTAAPGHGPPGPGLTDFNGVRTGWAEIRDEEDSFMRGWRWRRNLPGAAGVGRGSAGRAGKS